MSPLNIFTHSPLRSGFLGILVVAFVLAASPLLTRVEMLWLDTQMRSLQDSTPPPANESVVVVGIDDASLEEFGVPVATLHRQIGTFFEAMASAHPSVVGVDVVLPQASFDRIQPGLDAALARGILALRPVAPLVLGMGANAEGSLRTLHPLFANLAGPEGVASVFVPRDGDGVVRRFDERLGGEQQALPTLAGQMARRLDRPVGSGLVPYFRGEPFRYLPLRDVLAWQAAGDRTRLQETFGGKAVLLGSLLAHDDQHRVPVNLATSDAGDGTHGVFVHAAQLRALLGEGFIHPLPTPWSVVVALLFTCGWWLTPGRRSLLIAASTIALLMAASIQSLAAGWAVPAMTWSTAILLGVGGRSTLAAWQAAIERRRLRQTFDGFVSPAVLTEILAGRLDPALGGERRDVCVLFSDIRNFTTMSERMSPEAVTDLLNRYFERMTACIHRHGGTLDKFIGDGIMAFFGAPQPSDTACEQAFHTAREMLSELAAFNREQAALGAPQIAIGIGLHYGPALIGYIGAKTRHEYSAIGDTVNTASRLEGLTKEAGYPVVVSPAVRERLPQGTAMASLGVHPVKGRAPIELFGWKPQTLEQG